MTNRPTVYVVDDDADFRKSIVRLLRLSGYDIAHFESADELLAHFPDCGPCCILLDLNMPKMNGLELQARLADMGVNLPIVFLTGRGDISSSVKALKAGAEDFLCKPANKQDLLDAIERAVSRDQKAREDRVEFTGLRNRFDRLTPREKQVYSLVLIGKLNKQIAYELSTTERTVKAHRQNMMHKLQARSVVELLSFGERMNALADAHKGAPIDGVPRPVGPKAIVRAYDSLATS
jgi:FixJ family two-component response regulator